MKSLLTLTILALGLTAQAQIRLGVPIYGGTGCPQGTASVSLTEDQGTLSVLFDSFVAEAPTANGAAFDRKSCNLRIPVSIGPGFQIALTAIDYRGFAAIPMGGRGQFQATYSYVGQARPVTFTKSFAQGYIDSYSMSGELVNVPTSLSWSACSSGQNLMMAVNANILAVTNSRHEAANVSIDSVDISAGILYAVHVRRCQ